jgi:hypothetical protein
VYQLVRDVIDASFVYSRMRSRRVDVPLYELISESST